MGKPWKTAYTYLPVNALVGVQPQADISSHNYLLGLTARPKIILRFQVTQGIKKQALKSSCFCKIVYLIVYFSI